MPLGCGGGCDAEPAPPADARPPGAQEPPLANGCLIPFLALQMYYPPLIWGGSLWAITFPTATWLLALHFGRLQVH
jgi:hypothetical protein